MKMKIYCALIKTDLRSYFFDLLGLVNCTKNFKKHPSGLVSFPELCSNDENKKRRDTEEC